MLLSRRRPGSLYFPANFCLLQGIPKITMNIPTAPTPGRKMPADRDARVVLSRQVAVEVARGLLAARSCCANVLSSWESATKKIARCRNKSCGVLK